MSFDLFSIFFSIFSFKIMLIFSMLNSLNFHLLFLSKCNVFFRTQKISKNEIYIIWKSNECVLQFFLITPKIFMLSSCYTAHHIESLWIFLCLCCYFGKANWKRKAYYISTDFCITFIWHKYVFFMPVLYICIYTYHV